MELWSDPRCLLRQENEVLLLLDTAMEHRGPRGAMLSINGAHLGSPSATTTEHLNPSHTHTPTGKSHRFVRLFVHSFIQ